MSARLAEFLLSHLDLYTLFGLDNRVLFLQKVPRINELYLPFFSRGFPHS